MFFYLAGIIVLLLLPVSLIRAIVRSVKSGAFRREMKRQGILFYIGIVPLLILAAAALAMAVSGETLYTAAAILAMLIWGMAIAIIAEAGKRNNQ